MKRAALIFGLTLWTSVALGQTEITTYHYDNARTGQNTHETILTPAKVKTPDAFVRLFTHQVDGDVYAQPLYVHKLAIPGKGVHSVVFVATEGDSVYAFDAENKLGANANPLWKANLLDPSYGASAGAMTLCAATGAPAACSGNVGCTDIYPQYGITSTPVIDLKAGKMYVLSYSYENGNVVYRLHALQIATGKEKPLPRRKSHVEIAGTVNGITFQPAIQHSRPGLLLSDGVIYLGFGSHCDNESGNPTPQNTYHGWIFAYDAATLTQKGIFLTTPNGYRGGVWMEGAGLAGDKNGELFVATANGTFSATPASNGFQDFGDSIVKLDRNLGTPKDYFTPFDQGQMDSGGPGLGFDADLGSGGVLLLPDQPGSHPHLLVQAGKTGTIYLVDRDNMGRYCSGCTSDTNIPQELVNGVGCTPVPVYWNQVVYIRGDCDVLKAFALNNGMLSGNPQQTTDVYHGRLSVSANGNHDGIVWALNIDAAENGGEAILKAYDAGNLSLLYSSDTNAVRDGPGPAVKFTTPVVADGKVYVGASGRLSVYGLYHVRVEVTNVHESGGNWCATVTTVDATTDQPVAGTVTINRKTGPTNQEICFPACWTRGHERSPGTKPPHDVDREPSPCFGIVTVPGLPPKRIQVGPA